MSAPSVDRPASAVSVVARREPSATLDDRSSPSPGSTIGLLPALTDPTFSALTSTPTTSWPSVASEAAETLPTYPSPNTETFIFYLARGPHPPRLSPLARPLAAVVSTTGRLLRPVSLADDQC